MLRSSLLAIVAFAGLTQPSTAQASRATASNGVLIGVVLRDDATEAPIAHAEVTICALNLTTRTDTSGAYSLTGIRAGIHAVEIRAVGFSAVVSDVTWLKADTIQRDFMLVSLASHTLPVMEVAATRRLSEFEERRKLGKGFFMARDEFESRASSRVSDVLAHVPGLRIRRSRSGAEAFGVANRGLVSMRGSNTACFVHVYVDDALVFNSANEQPNRATGVPYGAFNLNSLATTEILGVEYYAGGASIPAKYNRTGSACGVLVIWTRNGPG